MVCGFKDGKQNILRAHLLFEEAGQKEVNRQHIEHDTCKGVCAGGEARNVDNCCDKNGKTSINGFSAWAVTTEDHA
jgi:hypothetical protein